MGILKRSFLQALFLLAPLLFSQLGAGPSNAAEESADHGVETRPLRTDAGAKQASGIEPDLKVDTDLVQIPVTVTDNIGRVIEHLGKENFTVYEDGAEQQIVHFGAEEVPVSVCLAIDSSGSMASKFHKANEAVLEFLRHANPEDEYCVIRFSDSPQVLVRMTTDSSQVARAISQIHPYGWTALLDAVHLSIQEVKTAHNRRKAIVLISDGGDNRSRHSEKSIKRLVRETEAQIYSIGIVATEDKWMYPVEVDGPSLMRGISNQSGGMLFLINGIDDLPAAIGKIESALRHQYVLGYYPTDHRTDGKYRRVTIKVSSPDSGPRLKAYWRAGYYAPAE